MAQPENHKRFAERVPTAIVGLIITDVGGSIPFGISDLDGDPNALEWAASVLFATIVIFAAISLAWEPSWLPYAAYASGIMWTLSALYMALNGDVNFLARIAFAFIFGGIGAGSVALGNRLRHEHKNAEPA